METLDTRSLKKEFNWRPIKRFIKLIIFLGTLTFIIWFLLYNNYEEVLFAFQHPEFVKELREVYIQEHNQADQNVLLRQRMDLRPTTVPQELKEPGELKKSISY